MTTNNATNEVREFCKKANCTEEQFYGRSIYTGRHILEDIEIPEGFNPFTLSNLFLIKIKELPQSFNPIVLGNLDITSVEKLPETFSPIVGKGLYLHSVTELPKVFLPIVKEGIYIPKIKTIEKNIIDKLCTRLYINEDTENKHCFDFYMDACETVEATNKHNEKIFSMLDIIQKEMDRKSEFIKFLINELQKQ